MALSPPPPVGARLSGCPSGRAVSSLFPVRFFIPFQVEISFIRPPVRSARLLGFRRSTTTLDQTERKKKSYEKSVLNHQSCPSDWTTTLDKNAKVV